MAAKSKMTDSIRGVVRFIRDDKFRLAMGTFLILFSLYLTVAFISYFFTWKEDQDFIWQQVFSGPGITVANRAGKVGAWLSAQFLNRWFGIAAFSIPVLMMVYGANILGIKLVKTAKFTRNLILITLLLSVCLGFLFGESTEFLGSGPGGAHGFFLSRWLIASLGMVGTAFVLFLGIFVFLMYHLHRVPSLRLFAKRKKKNIPDQPGEPESEPDFEVMDTNKDEKAAPSYNEAEEDNPDENTRPSGLKDTETDQLEDEVKLTIEQNTEEEKLDHNSVDTDYDPKLDLANFKFPPLSILKDHASDTPKVSNEELMSNKRKIIDTLANYKIQIDQIKATIGPTVTLYEIVPAPGIRIAKIKNLDDDIALSLSALGIRIIAPIPGKGTIGIEVPNQHPRIVSLRSVLSSRKFQESRYELPVALGKTISNETFVFDLARMPHLLMAGATGQGKSVGLNAIIASLLYKKHPSQLKFVLVDPKKVELSLYTRIERHYLAKLPDSEEAIITDTQKVVTTLKSLTVEMDSRYDLMQAAQVRDIKEYNHKFIKRKLNPEKGHRYFPYIVLVIDEFADLIMTAGREIVDPIARLAQLARAIGIHLIIATQRPTTNIITGLIKANFPARVAFRVMSVIDSRTILDLSGANQLIGKGDMLIASGNDTTRLQCAFVDTAEIEELTDFIGSQRAYPSAHLLPEVEEGVSESEQIDLTKRDARFEEAARLVVQTQQGSTSMIQRKLSLGYNRAGRIVDQLEAAGILGPFEGSKAREVLIQDELSLEQILSNLN